MKFEKEAQQISLIGYWTQIFTLSQHTFTKAFHDGVLQSFTLNYSVSEIIVAFRLEINSNVLFSPNISSTICMGFDNLLHQPWQYNSRSWKELSMAVEMND